MKQFKTIFLGALILIMALSFWGCDKRTAPKEDIGQTIGGITLSAKATIIPLVTASDNDVDYAQLTATVLDKQGVGISNIPVTFSKTATDTLGVIIVENNRSNSSGNVAATVKSYGDTGRVVVRANVAGTNFSDEISLQFVEFVTVPGVENIEVSTARKQVPIDGDVESGEVGQTTITARPKNKYGISLANVPVVFSLAENSLGSINQVDAVSGQNGTITATLTCSDTGFVKVYAEVLGDYGVEIMDSTEVIFYSQGEIQVPKYIEFMNVPGILPEGVMSQEIAVKVSDERQQPIANWGVSFYSTKGTIEPRHHTNEEGIAYTKFSAGTDVGDVEFTASTFVPGEDSLSTTATTTITSGMPQSLAPNANSYKLQVQGTGGTEHALLKIELRDGAGNLVNRLPASPEDGSWAWSEDSLKMKFKILSPQAQGSINGAYLGNQAGTFELVVPIDNGVANCNLHSGIYAGALAIQVTWLGSVGHPEYASPLMTSLQNINIVSGPPANADLSISPEGEWQEGLWELQVASYVTDKYNGAVKDSTAVFFELLEVEGDMNNTSDCVVISQAFTYNENRQQAQNQGWAYSLLTYAPYLTNRMVTLKSSCANSEVWDTLSYRLPIQGGRITVQTETATIPIHQGNAASIPSNPPFHDMVVRAKLMDRQENPIKDARLLFHVEPTGSFVGFPANYQPDQQWAWTDEEGVAINTIRILSTEIEPCPQGQFSLDNPVNVTVMLATEPNETGAQVAQGQATFTIKCYYQ